jgi:luciferase family oxidoreductase group 1
VTAAALRRNHDALGADDFPEQLRDLFAFFDGTHPRITATPGHGYRPAIWMLGSSDYSAQVAGMLGLPFSFAHHFASANTLAAVEAYRAAFRPSTELAEPYVLLGVPVICAETDDRARFIAKPSQVSFLRLRQGRPTRMPSPEEAAELVFTPMERELLRSWNAPLIVGDPDTVRAGLDELAACTGANELMITTMVHGAADRLRSYELVAEAVGLQPARS